MDTQLITDALDRHPEVAVFLDSLIETQDYWYEVSDHPEITGFVRVRLFAGEEWELPVESWTLGPGYIGCVNTHGMPLWDAGEFPAWNSPLRIKRDSWW